MRHMGESGNSASKVIVILICIIAFSLLGIYLCRKVINDSNAEGIINSVWVRANQRKAAIEAQTNLPDGTDLPAPVETRTEYNGYFLMATDDPISSFIKVETAKKTISEGLCGAIKSKLAGVQWRGTFERVMILDRLGGEKGDILLAKCPKEEVPALRFYVRFFGNTEEELSEFIPEKEQSSEENTPIVSVAPVASVPSSNVYSVPSSVSVSRPSSSVSRISCPAGTSTSGLGAAATSGCRCISSSESWNGSQCVSNTCPEGSSRSSSGDLTDVSGCHCNAENPKWVDGRCIKNCSGNKVYDFAQKSCVCPAHTVVKKDSLGECVECNTSYDCYSGTACIANKCLTIEEQQENECRWGVCQTCDEGGRKNVTGHVACEVAGLEGVCNDNGTCYPVRGRRCASQKGCPAGEFCNYGGNLNSSKKQKGKFGQTPNVCQKVQPQEFVHEGVTYYYNSQKDLQAWCRAGNNKPNCMWGYLAKPGAESWCASLGKRLLTRTEMTKVWGVLRDQLPKTYKGYAYWVNEGAWIENEKGKLSFGKGHPDGYMGRGGVVCR